MVQAGCQKGRSGIIGTKPVRIFFMALILMLLAALCAATTNFFMRRSIDAGGSTRAYLAIQMVVALVVMLLMGPARNPGTELNWPICFLGAVSGLFLALMLYMLGKALEKGPAGLTFSILSSATIVPSIILAILYGETLGCTYTVFHGIGSLLVVLGLFWAGFGLQGMQDKKKWLQFSFAMFALHVALLVVFQWRGILSGLDHPEWIASAFTKEVLSSEWYLPMLYLAASAFQLTIFFKNKSPSPTKQEWLCGVGGGIGNGLCTYLMIVGSEVATMEERAVMFPLFSIATIIFSNLWSQALYKEKIHWKASQLCALGILVATVNWGLLGDFSSNVFGQKDSTAQKEESRDQDRTSNEVGRNVAENDAR